ncbi:50S ribosomal protein L18 [Spirochaeta lutea]|uniref:Large ribosomal subunit protein uL18 n=1 Tax=Spirochaeta lutea TaxID=1480694 RepID=A0A098QS24_9SPIO|nr:50S ribosomal protein L18 [Spirochaeta lutea]KGE70675.1 50S ribosomal protein L18 [Spirochaeta lutea]
MKRIQEKLQRRARRKLRVRKNLKGTAQKPRISVYKSNKNLYIQVIDDLNGHTITSASTVGEFKDLKVSAADAEKLGEALGKKMLDLKIQTAVFDRNGYLYHGVVKAVAEGTRKAGIKI